MAEETLNIAVDARGVARLTMNRPDVRNAFNAELIDAICDAMGRLNADPAVRVVVITGEGSAFSAGADINMMREAAGYSPAENKDDARRLAHMLTAIHDCAKPTIARINGPAMGGALGIVAACDVAVAAEEAIFAFTEVRVGLIPAVISPFVVRAMGPREARRFFLTAERFDADTAKRIGLVHMVAMGAQLDATVAGVVDDILKASPSALREAKELVRAVAFSPLSDATMETVAGIIARVRASDEGVEGLTAFLEKRRPSWLPAANDA